MSNENEINRCPKCQAPLPPEAPQGLCPKCLLEAASTPTETGDPTQKGSPPPIHTVVTAFPNLEILEMIGHGGMGVVYKARQPKLDRFVALKLLSQSLATDPAFAERFHREARLLARLNHPNIVSVYDYGEANGFFFLLMEYVDGVNLRQALQLGRFTPQQALELVPKICEALQFAHEEGILHRDIKPENILLDSRGRIKIADFGIAKLLGAKTPDTALTASGSAIGTPQYMAPEQLEHRQDIDQRADIYSLGVVFYEMLTGELPLGRFAPPSQKSAVDPRVDEVVLRALEKEREKRYRSAGEVKTQVEHISGSIPQIPETVRVESASGGPKWERVSRCYYSTPERMRDCWPGFGAHIFVCKGELRLDSEKLEFFSDWRTSLLIPLENIRELGIGQFKLWHTPWLMKYERLSYLSVTFMEGERTRTVHLTPVTERAASPASVHGCAADWLEAIQKAVTSRAGAPPGSPAPGTLAMSAQPSWLRKVKPFIIWFLVCALGFAIFPEGVAVLFFFGSLGLGAVLILFSVTFMKANSAIARGDLDAITSNDPPDQAPPGGPGGFGGSSSPSDPESPRKGRRLLRWALWFGVGVVAVLALLVVLLANLMDHADTRRASTRRPEAVLHQSTVREQERFPGLTFFRYRMTVPARHVAVFQFFSETNGAMQPVDSLSGWIVADPTKSTQELVQWTVQDGVRLSPELKNQERWDANIGGSQASLWLTKRTNNWATESINDLKIRPNNIERFTLLNSGSPTQPLVQVEVTLLPVPADLAYPGRLIGAGGTNWVEAVKKSVPAGARTTGVQAEETSPPNDIGKPR